MRTSIRSRIAVMVVVLGVAALTAGCGSSPGKTAERSDLSSSTTQAVTTTAPTTTALFDPYEKYLELTAQLGGKVIGREDAATRAAINCSGAAKSMYGGVPLSQFPTDLALVRAYCPEKESGL